MARLPARILSEFGDVRARLDLQAGTMDDVIVSWRDHDPQDFSWVVFLDSY
jgi:hypothetical protein